MLIKSCKHAYLSLELTHHLLVRIMTNEPIYSVSELNEAAKMLLEHHFSTLLLEGEISNFSCPSSGHWYFTLKDEAAQIRCAMFRAQTSAIQFYPANGMHVVIRAKVSLYIQRGEYQLIASHMEEAGIGILQKRFEALKQKLFNEGLFDDSHKQLLPRYPKKIGIITSITGAAIHDVLSVLKRRYPIAEICIFPTLVQGNQAAENITRMIKHADKEKICDVLLLTRGGGSLEDLWPFNEEIVARAIYHCRLPIITGIGHEIDFTIADFVADVRAPTPSAAAETLVPDKAEINACLTQKAKQLQHLFQSSLHQKALLMSQLTQRLNQQHPKACLDMQQQQLQQYQRQLPILMNNVLLNKKTALSNLGKQLHQLSPLNTLDRGYAILFQNEKTVSSVETIHKGETLSARLKDGTIHCHVTQVVKQ
jgi:exodeoxyribonuclease VII large subunit